LYLPVPYLDMSRTKARMGSMKALARSGIVTLLVLVFLIGGPVIYSTAKGYTEWWLLSSGQVTVDGARNGYLHTNWSRTAVFITRTDSKPHQSYMFLPSHPKYLHHCGAWHAPRFPAFPIGDLRPPCLGFGDEPDPPRADPPVSSTISSGPNRLEFTTARGKHVTALW
jgi:hypothetical protein